MSKVFRFGPIALTNTLTTDLLNPATSTGGVNSGTPGIRIVLTHIRVVNKTAASHTFSLWLGATGANAAGTEVIGNGQVVPANSYFDWYGQLAIDAADFLVGGADANTALTIQGEGTIVIV